MIKVLVCGGREFTNWKIVYHVLDKLKKDHGEITVIHGAASGADTLAENWAKQAEQVYIGCPAKWSQHGRSAGPIRNMFMLDSDPDLVVAFPGGDGTAHMVKIAKEAGKDVLEIEKMEGKEDAVSAPEIQRAN